jgi:hypothetical protein
VLVEASQVLPDGRTRTRNLLPSEKMLAGEAWQGAARRAVAEELGSALPSPHDSEALVLLDEASHAVRAVAQASMSYPGLRTEYEVNSARVGVDALPQDGDCEEGFTTTEPREEGQLLTHWAWRAEAPPQF